MAETTQSASDGANVVYTTQGAQAPESKPTADAVQSTSDDEGWRNPREIKDALKTIRELKAEMADLRKGKALSPSPAIARDDTNEVQSLRRELEMRDILGDLGVTGKQRELLMLAAQSARPTNMREFLESYAVKATQPATQPPQTIQHPTAPSNTGAAMSDPLGVIPESPFALRPETIRQMSPDQIKAHWANYIRKNSTNYNPFAAKNRNLNPPVQSK